MFRIYFFIFAVSGLVLLACDSPEYKNAADPGSSRFVESYVLLSVFSEGQNSEEPPADGPGPDPLCNPCRIFTSDNTYEGDLGGIAGADAKCNDEMDLSHPGDGTFKAMLSDGTNRIACTSDSCGVDGAAEHVDWVLRPNVVYTRVDGTVIKQTMATIGIFEYDLDNPVWSGGMQGDPWTGMQGNWLATASNCAGWTNNTTGSGTRGYNPAVDGSFLGIAPNDCAAQPRELYCVEQ